MSELFLMNDMTPFLFLRRLSVPFYVRRASLAERTALHLRLFESLLASRGDEPVATDRRGGRSCYGNAQGKRVPTHGILRSQPARHRQAVTVLTGVLSYRLMPVGLSSEAA